MSVRCLEYVLAYTCSADMTRTEKVAKSLILEFASTPGRIAPLLGGADSRLSGRGAMRRRRIPPCQDSSAMGRVARPPVGAHGPGVPAVRGCAGAPGAEARPCPWRSRPGFARPGARGGGRAVSAPYRDCSGSLLLWHRSVLGVPGYAYRPMNCRRAKPREVPSAAGAAAGSAAGRVASAGGLELTVCL